MSDEIVAAIFIDDVFELIIIQMDIFGKRLF